jgi:NAD(P)-dependent dehydrogenase (short-subunit alcohol dehydrogenase family)
MTIPLQEQAKQPGEERLMTPRPDYLPFYPGCGKFRDQVLLISGGDSGIGRAVAVAFAREGARIAFLFKDEYEDAKETVELIEQEHGEAMAIAGDIGEPSFSEEAVAKVIGRFGRIDILVNNAAEQHVVDDIGALDIAQFERIFRTNVFGYFYLTRAARRHLGPGASIINTVSITAYRGSGDLLDYSATRGAALAFTRSLSQQLLRHGIRVNGVAPGPIWTPLIPASFDSSKVARHGQDTPMGRPGQPNEVAPCYTFLASRDAAYISGQVLHPNGGVIVNA